MYTYIISYDLLKPGQDYSLLHAAIKSVSGYWAHPLESFWIVRSGMTAEQIRDYLLPYIDGNDKILVAATGFDWAALNLGQANYNWLFANWMVKAAA